MALWQTVTLGWVLGLTNGGDGGGRAISNVSTLATTGNVTVGGALTSTGAVTAGSFSTTGGLTIGQTNGITITGSAGETLSNIDEYIERRRTTNGGANLLYWTPSFSRKWTEVFFSKNAN